MKLKRSEYIRSRKHVKQTVDEAILSEKVVKIFDRKSSIISTAAIIVKKFEENKGLFKATLIVFHDVCEDKSKMHKSTQPRFIQEAQAKKEYLREPLMRSSENKTKNIKDIGGVFYVPIIWK
jgi:hypothetical protein